MAVVYPKILSDIEAQEIIWGPPPLILHSKDLRVYQNWMSEKIETLPGLILGAEMGLGKTGATLKAAASLLAAGAIRRILVVAPLHVAEDTWPEEIAKWAFSRKFRFTVVVGSEPQRRAALERMAQSQVVIINRENLVWLFGLLGMRGWKFDMVIYDEVSRLKSGRKQSKPKPRKDGTVPPRRITELGVLTKTRITRKKFVGLSGTPSPNGLIDLWGPLHAVDGGARLGSSMTAYKSRWFYEPKWGYDVFPKPHAEEEIMSRISDVFFSLREEDYLDLPPLIERDHKVRLDPSELRQYRKFEREMAMSVVNRMGEREVIAAVNNGVLTQKLMQFANGSMYLGDKFDTEDETKKLPRESVKIHTHKLDVLESIMNEAAGRPVLVAYSFQFDKDAIRKRFPYVRVFGETVHDKRDWNAGRIRMLLTHPASAGHGLNFQFGSNIAVLYGLTWSLELYRQFVKRLHRSGQKHDKVFLHRIITQDTIDETILPRLIDRGATQDRISDAVRVRLRRAA